MPTASFAPYEIAGPSLLAGVGPLPAATPKRSDPQWAEVRNFLERRLNGLRNTRLSWWSHWAEVARVVLPRRYHYLITPNLQRGRIINQAILNSTATRAMRICAAGMMSAWTNPSSPWFRFVPGISNFELDEGAQRWLDEVQSRVYTVMAESNFYDALRQMYEDLVTFGTAPILIYEDPKDLIRCYNPCAGEYYLATGADFRVETFYRQFVLTVSQLVEMFGLDNVGPDVQGLWRTKGNLLDTEQVVAHAIEPNFPLGTDKGNKLGVVPGGFAFREVYWLWGKSTPRPLSMRGFYTQPFIPPRWATTSNDAYGRSPGMDALGDILQLQMMEARLAEAIEKQVRPPMQADVGLQNQPSSTLPGEITYVADVAKGGMRPIYEVNPQIGEMTRLIERIEKRINEAFFVDMFQMMAQMEGVQPRNEMEIAERRGEKMQVLGPVSEKFQTEGASLAIMRILSIMQRRALLPPKPRSLQGVPIDIKYDSMFAQVQRAAATAGMERTLAMAGRMAAVWPGTLDNIDSDALIRDYADKQAFPAKDLNAKDQVAMIRQQKMMAQQQAEQKAQMMQTAVHAAPALTQAAQNLSQIDTGGGLSALQMMLQGQGGGAPQPGAPA